MGTNGRSRRRAIGALLLAAYGLALTVNRSLRDVEGRSMSPTLSPGDRIVVAPIPPARLRPGAIVVVRDPRHPARATVKRLHEHLGDALVVLGDDPSVSTDSRTFGPVPHDLYVGKVVWRLRPWGPI